MKEQMKAKPILIVLGKNYLNTCTKDARIHLYSGKSKYVLIEGYITKNPEECFTSGFGNLFVKDKKFETNSKDKLKIFLDLNNLEIDHGKNEFPRKKILEMNNINFLLRTQNYPGFYESLNIKYVFCSFYPLFLKNKEK